MNTININNINMVSSPNTSMLVLTNPTKNAVDFMCNVIEDIPYAEKPLIVVLDNTPRAELENMCDYNYLKENCERYSNVVQPFWSDDDTTTSVYLTKLYKLMQKPSIGFDGTRHLEGGDTGLAV